jgi:hypothetical protein
MPYGEATYEQYLKNFRRRHQGNTRGAMTRQAWETYRHMRTTGAAPSNLDIAEQQFGLKRGPITQYAKERQANQQSILNFLNNLKGGLR